MGATERAVGTRKVATATEVVTVAVAAATAVARVLEGCAAVTVPVAARGAVAAVMVMEVAREVVEMGGCDGGGG